METLLQRPVDLDDLHGLLASRTSLASQRSLEDPSAPGRQCGHVTQLTTDYLGLVESYGLGSKVLSLALSLWDAGCHWDLKGALSPALP